MQCHPFIENIQSVRCFLAAFDVLSQVRVMIDLSFPVGGFRIDETKVIGFGNIARESDVDTRLEHKLEILGNDTSHLNKSVNDTVEEIEIIVNWEPSPTCNTEMSTESHYLLGDICEYNG